MSLSLPNLGHGVGLRSEHFSEFLKGKVPVDWVEAISENFFVEGGRPRAVLEAVRQQMPVVLHGVSLSIGGADALDKTHLHKLRQLARWVEPAWVSDHLCWGTHQGRYLHDLLPLPFTEEALAHVVARVGQVQETLGRQILLENVSSYLTFSASTLTEWDFLAEVARRADCGILLDVNNIYVSAQNHGFDAEAYLQAIPVDRVGQFHLAGYADKGTHLLDTHDSPVTDPVWALYREAVRRFGPVTTLIEWDERIPPLQRLLEESQHARQVALAARAEAA
ncbi:MAG: DUF692 domain-containing protein [Myxococcaceae bacterium]